MNNTHFFNTKIAEELGIECAILFQNISFWIEKNESNERNLHEGRYWTYNSAKAFAKLFPYMTESKIRRSLGKLKEKGWILTGNYNKVAYDRTQWYALTDYANSIIQNRQMEVSEMGNGLGAGVTPIPDILPDEKQDSKPKASESFKTFWKAWPKKVGKKNAEKWWTKHKPDDTLLQTIIRAVTKQAATEAWTKNNGQFIPHPATWLNGERWEDETGSVRSAPREPMLPAGL